MLPVVLDFLLVVADVEVSELVYESCRQHLIYTSIQAHVQSCRATETHRHTSKPSSCCTDAHTAPVAFSVVLINSTNSVLTVHVSVQPEDAGVWVPQRPPQLITSLLPPLLLQPVAVGDARLLVDLKTPSINKNTCRDAVVKLNTFTVCQHNQSVF